MSKISKEIISNSINAALAADAYSLGAHWVYDIDQLKSLNLDWDALNDPVAEWHRGKKKGDFTHYGDHCKWLIEFLKDKEVFEVFEYAKFWLDKSKDYKGYMDGSSKETKQALESDINCINGSSSHDLSIAGRIAPLLRVSPTKDVFLKNVNSFSALTHNNPRVLQVTEYFASVLFDVASGSKISEALTGQKINADIKDSYNSGLESEGADTLTTIHKFGPSCDVNGGFEGTLHVLSSFNDYKEAMVTNAKSGGDSSSRAMVVGMIMGAAGYSIPENWKV